MLEKSKEIKFGKPSRKRVKKGTKKGRRRRQDGDSPKKIEKITKNGKSALKLPNGRIVTEGSPGYAGALTKYTSQAQVDKNRANTQELSKIKDDSPTDSNESVANPNANKSNLAVNKSTPPDDKDVNLKANLEAGAEATKQANKQKKNINKKLDELNKAPGPVKKKGDESTDVIDRRTGESGSDSDSSNPYADAKKKDAKLDTWIKQRNNSKKGSDEYIMAQNKINAAYNKGPQRKLNPVKEVEGKKATEIKSKSPAKKLAVKPAPRTTPDAKSNTGAGSGITAKESVNKVKDELQSMRDADKKSGKNIGITTESDNSLPPSLSAKKAKRAAKLQRARDQAANPDKRSEAEKHAERVAARKAKRANKRKSRGKEPRKKAFLGLGGGGGAEGGGAGGFLGKLAGGPLGGLIQKGVGALKGGLGKLGGGGGPAVAQEGTPIDRRKSPIARKGPKSAPRAERGMEGPSSAPKKRPSITEELSGKDVKKMARKFKRSGRKAIRRGDEETGEELKRVGSNLKTKGKAKKKVERAERKSLRKAKRTLRRSKRNAESIRTQNWL